MIQFKLALRYLLRKPITLFAVISVMMGAAAFVVVLGVMDGYITEFHERSRMILSDMIVSPSRASRRSVIFLPDALMESAAKDVKGIVAWSPVIAGTGIVKVRGKDGSFALRWCRFWGVDPRQEFAVTHMQALSEVPADGDKWIVAWMELLGARTPEETRDLVLVTSAVSPGGPTRRKRLNMASTVKFGLDKFDSEFAYVPRSVARKLTMPPDAMPGVDLATEIRVRIDDPERSIEIRNQLQDALDRSFPGRYTVKRYQDESSIYAAHESQRSLARLVLMCLFIAAGFAVVAICYMIVLQKTRDIGTLRTLGLSRGGVLATFVGYGVAMGVTGAALGIGLGVFILSRLDWVRATLTKILGHDPFPATLYALEEVPSEVKAGNLVLILAVAVAVSFFGSLYPAWRAARLNVVESLRYE